MNLRRWIFDHAMNMTEFAKRVNVHRSYLFYLMKGTKSVGPKTMKLIREVTNNEVSSKEDLLDERR